MARLIAVFIRHAAYHQLPNTPSALQPFALTKEGVIQSEQAATEMHQFISQQQWHVVSEIHTSSALRAWQTAQIFKEQLQDLMQSTAQLKSFDVLAERSVGSAANLTINQIEQVIQDDPRYEALPHNWKANSHYKLPFIGAESLLEAGQRVATHLIQQMQQLTRSGSDMVQVFVGHGASFRHAAYTLGLLNEAQITTLSMYHAKPIYFEYLPNGKWQHIAGDWKVRAKQSEYTD